MSSPTRRCHEKYSRRCPYGLHQTRLCPPPFSGRHSSPFAGRLQDPVVFLLRLQHPVGHRRHAPDRWIVPDRSRRLEGTTNTTLTLCFHWSFEPSIRSRPGHKKRLYRRRAQPSGSPTEKIPNNLSMTQLASNLQGTPVATTPVFHIGSLRNSI